MSQPESPNPSVTASTSASALTEHAGSPAQTWYDRVTSRLRSDPVLARRWAVLAPALLTLLAGVLRLWNLGHPATLVFDETYYVKDAWSQWILGYTAQWPPEGADERFAAGDSDIFSSEGSFSVHPPLGKWLIGAGMALFGADSSVGWRIAVALIGTATVLVLYLLAHTMTRSIAFATVAALLMTVDGQAIVMSRVALLDGILTFFVLLAVWFVALDTRSHASRVAALTAARAGPHAWGPVLWNRPWVIAAGAAAGCAGAVKWSGLYVLAALGLYLVVVDAWARRRAGVGYWPTDTVLRQGPVSFALLVPVAVVVYLSTWTGWLFTQGGWGRDLGASPGPWGWVPEPLRSLWLFHEEIYGFHVGLTSEHGYASPAWEWPLLLRPTSMFYESAECGAGTCVQNIYSLNNPLIWYAGAAAVLWLVYRFAVRPRWQTGLVLTGIVATYVPWLFYPERTIFQFYTVAILPFLVLALACALRDISGSASFDPARRASGQRLVWVFLVVALLLAAFWYPIQTAMTVPYEFWRLHNWLPGWV